MRQWLELQAPDHFLLIEPDQELASIAVVEMKQRLTFPVQTCAPEHCNDNTLEGAIALVLSIQSKTLRDLVPKNRELVTLRLRSAADSLAPYLPVPSTALVSIASRWAPFLKTASTMLIAAGFHPDCLLLRDASKANWRRGLNQASAIICDSLTAQGLDGKPRTLIFSLLAESSLREPQEYEQFIRGQLAPWL